MIRKLVRAMPSSVLICAVGAAMLLLCAVAYSAEYPSAPIKLIVPAPAGGGADRVARLLAKEMADSLKQSVVVDNRPGAGGNIAADLVAHSAPDGYTLLLGHSAIVGVNPRLYDKASFDPISDLTPIVPILRSWMYLFVPAKSAWHSLTDFVLQAKQKPGILNYGSAGVGSPHHLGMEYIKRINQLQVTHIPYKGSTPLMTALVRGEVDIAFDFYIPGMEFAQAGKLRTLAIASEKRNPAHPDVPTLTEIGGPKDFPGDVWVGVFGPAKLPAPIVQRLLFEISKAADSAEMTQALRMSGSDRLALSPIGFKALVASEAQRGARLVEMSGARADQ